MDKDPKVRGYQELVQIWKKQLDTFKFKANIDRENKIEKVAHDSRIKGDNTGTAASVNADAKADAKAVAAAAAMLAAASDKGKGKGKGKGKDGGGKGKGGGWGGYQSPDKCFQFEKHGNCHYGMNKRKRRGAKCKLCTTWRGA